MCKTQKRKKQKKKEKCSESTKTLPEPYLIQFKSRQQIYNKKKKEILTAYLDSWVEMKFQYLRSSIPVMVNAFEEMDKQIPPVFLSSEISFTQTKFNRKKNNN